MAKEVLEVEARLKDNISKEMKKLEGQLKKFAKENKRSFAEVKKETIANFAAQGKFNKAAALQGKRLVTLANGTKKYETRLQTANRLLKENATRLSAASGAVQKKTSFTKRLTQSLIKSAVAIGGMILGLTQIIRLGRSIAGGIFNAGVAVEQFTVSLQAVAGSAEVANRQLRKIREFAAASPLETKDVTEAFVKLKAVGIPATFEVTKALGNVGLVFGRSLDEVSTAFISLNRRVLRRFGVIVDRTGKKAVLSMAGIRKEVEKNDVAIRGALLEAWGEKYPNALELASNTTSARLAVMRSEFFELGAAIGEGVNPKIKEMADTVGGLAKDMRRIFFRKTLPLEEQLAAVNKKLLEAKNLQKPMEERAEAMLDAFAEGADALNGTVVQLKKSEQLRKSAAEWEKRVSELQGKNEAQLKLETARRYNMKLSRVEELRLMKESLETQIKLAKGGEEQEGTEDRRLAILDKVAILRSQLASKNLKLQLDNLEKERDALISNAEKSLTIESERDDAVLTIRKAFAAKIKDIQDQLQKDLKKQRDGAWKEEQKEIKERSKAVIKAYKEQQAALKAERDAQDELARNRMEYQQQELERFRTLAQQINEAVGGLAAEQTEIIIDQMVKIAQKQGTTVEKVFDQMAKKAQMLEGFAQSLGAALASGVGKGIEGLKESLRNVLITVIDFLQRMFLTSLAGAGFKAVLGDPSALVKMGLATAAFEAAKAAVSSFQGGTGYAPGGRAIVGEEGPELVDLPRGSRVYNANQTRNVMNVNVAGSTFNFNGSPSPSDIDRVRRADNDRLAGIEELFRKKRVDVSRFPGLQPA